MNIGASGCVMATLIRADLRMLSRVHGKNMTCLCTSVCALEAPGLGTIVTDGIPLKVDGGDGTVLLK